MMNIKHVIAAAALGTATLAPTVASADLSGNAGVMSQYLFRGLPQSTSASVYGGLDYGHESGFYAGTWAATINFGTAGSDSTEVDVYAGFAGDAGAMSYDVGVLYYWYPEQYEPAGPEMGPGLDTYEVYGSLGFGPVSLSAYLTPGDYFGATNPDGSDADGAYGVAISSSFPLTDILAFDASLAMHGGEGNEAFTPDGDSYLEYNAGVSAGLDNGFAFGFGFVGTDIDNDDPKLVVDASYSFDLM